MGIWDWFNGPIPNPYPPDEYFIIDEVGRWQTDLDYVTNGLEDGWLVLRNHYIRILDEVTVWEYQLVGTTEAE
jgi:hypothetical protein